MFETLEDAAGNAIGPVKAVSLVLLPGTLLLGGRTPDV